MAFWNKKKGSGTGAARKEDVTAGEVSKSFAESAAAPLFDKAAQDALEKAWNDSGEIAKFVTTLGGLEGARFKATAEKSWMRDLSVEGDAKPPVLVQTVTIEAQAKGESTRTPEVVSIQTRKTNDGDVEFTIESSGLAALSAVTTEGRGKALNTLNAWRAKVESTFGLTDMQAAIQKKEAAFTKPSAPPIAQTAKP